MGHILLVAVANHSNGEDLQVCLRTQRTPKPLAIIPKEARTTSQVSCDLMPLIRSDSDPKKQAAPTVQIALEGCPDCPLGKAIVVVRGLRIRKSTTNRMRNIANPILRDPFWTNQETARSARILTMKASRNLADAASVLVISLLTLASSRLSLGLFSCFLKGCDCQLFKSGVSTQNPIAGINE